MLQQQSATRDEVIARLTDNLTDVIQPGRARSECADGLETQVTLLQMRVEARPQVLSKARLEAALYGFGEALESNAIEVYVHHLRRKLGAHLIQTMRGVGYFVPRDKSA